MNKNPSQLLNMKNLSDISSIKLMNTPIQNNLYKQNLNNTHINDKIVTHNYNIESETNMNLLTKGKSSTNLPHFNRNSILNNTQIVKIGENNLIANYTGFNFIETPVRQNINEHNNNDVSLIKEGKSIYLNLGRLYDDKENDRSKSPRLINHNNVSHISMNKGVIKNIETNVIEYH